MRIKLYPDDYLMAMGIVGIHRLIQANREYEWVDSAISDAGLEVKEDHVVINTELLSLIPELYFHYLLRHYSVHEREKNRLQGLDRSNLTAKDKLDTLKRSMKGNIDKLQKEFSDRQEFLEMLECYDELKSLKPKEAEPRLSDMRERYLSRLETPEFDVKITLNFFKSVVLMHMYGQPSFLNVSKNKLSLDEQINLMRKDYIEPVLLDVELQSMLDDPEWNDNRKNQLLELLDRSSSNVYKAWKREVKKLDPEQICEYFHLQLRCTFLEKWMAVQNFEEMMFSPLGISSKAFNFSWNLRADQPVPLSSLARLVLFMIPIGVTPYYRYVNGQFETFYGFVYCNGTPGMIIRNNEHLQNLERNETFDRLIPKLLDREKYKAHQQAKADVMFIEFSSNYDSKKTIMNYYHLPPHVVRYFSTDNLQKIHYISNRNLRERFLYSVMESVDPATVIWDHMRETIRNERRNSAIIWAWRERLKIENLKKGREAVDNAKIVNFLYMEGQEVRRRLNRASDQRGETADYVSGGDKKAAALAYRLLNAAKAGNKDLFLDTLLRLYLQVNMPVPQVFMNALHEKKLDFASVAGAFITGMIPGERPDGRSDTSNNSEAERLTSN